MKNKSESFSKFKLYKPKVENLTGKKIGTVRSDNGGEFMSQEFETFLGECGIDRELTVQQHLNKMGLLKGTTKH